MITLDDNPGELVDLLAHRRAFDDVAVSRDTSRLGEDRICEGIPFHEDSTRLHVFAICNRHPGAIDHRMTFAFATARIEDRYLGVAAHHDVMAVAIFDGAQAGKELDPTFRRRLDTRRFGAPRGRTTDVESPHRQLRARFTDRLRSDHTDRFTHVHHRAA